MLAVAHLRQPRLRQFGERFGELLHGIGVVAVKTNAIAGVGHLLRHVPVEGGAYHLTGIVAHISAVGVGNGGALGRAHTHHADLNASLACLGCGLNGVVLVVLAIGDYYDGLLCLGVV